MDLMCDCTLFQSKGSLNDFFQKQQRSKAGPGLYLSNISEKEITTNWPKILTVTTFLTEEITSMCTDI